MLPVSTWSLAVVETKADLVLVKFVITGGLPPAPWQPPQRAFTKELTWVA